MADAERSDFAEWWKTFSTRKRLSSLSTSVTNESVPSSSSVGEVDRAAETQSSSSSESDSTTSTEQEERVPRSGVSRRNVVPVRHRKRRLFACSTCEQSFARHGHLIRHRALAHRKVKIFSCRACYKKFRRKNQFLLHFSQCERKFKTKNRSARPRDRVVHEESTSSDSSGSDEIHRSPPSDHSYSQPSTSMNEGGNNYLFRDKAYLKMYDERSIWITDERQRVTRCMRQSSTRRTTSESSVDSFESENKRFARQPYLSRLYYERLDSSSTSIQSYDGLNNTKVTYRCPVCEQSFQDEQSLTVHLEL